MFEIEYEFHEDDLVFFNESQLQGDISLQNRLRYYRLLVPGILLFFSAYYYQNTHEALISAAVAIVGILWAVYAPKVIRANFRQQILKKYTDAEKANMFGTYKLSLNKDFLIEQSPSGEHKMAWDDLVRVEYAPKYVFIYTELNAALVISVAAVKKGNLEQFAEQVDKMLERVR